MSPFRVNFVNMINHLLLQHVVWYQFPRIAIDMRDMTSFCDILGYALATKEFYEVIVYWAPETFATEDSRHLKVEFITPEQMSMGSWINEYDAQYSKQALLDAVKLLEDAIEDKRRTYPEQASSRAPTVKPMVIMYDDPFQVFVLSHQIRDV